MLLFLVCANDTDITDYIRIVPSGGNSSPDNSILGNPGEIVAFNGDDSAEFTLATLSSVTTNYITSVEFDVGFGTNGKVVLTFTVSDGVLNNEEQVSLLHLYLLIQLF